MDIGRLMRPRRICVVGASEKEGFGGDTCRNVISGMDENRYFLVSDKRSEIFGHRAYRSMSDVPEDFDLAVICTPMRTVEAMLLEASGRGAAGAVVYASGYAEVGTREGILAQESLKKLCARLGMGLVGPNCAGFANFIDGAYPFAFISEDRDRRGSIGFVSQSGQLCLSMMDSPAPKFSYAISAGNCAVTFMEDYIDFLVCDESTKVVAIYLEGVQDPGRLAASFRKAALARKPIVVLKTGRSEKGGRLAASHTGSLAGSDRVYDALFKKFGVIRVDDLEELIHASQLFATLKRIPRSAGFACVSLSGGETGICADVGAMNGIDFPDFSQSTKDALAAMLPSYATPANPLDATATLSYDEAAFADCLRVLMRDDSCSAVLVGYTLLQDVADPAIRYMAKAMETVSREEGSKPMVMIPFAGNTRNAEYSALLERCGVPILPPAVYAFRILRYLSDFIKYDHSEKNLSPAIPARAKGGARHAMSAHGAMRAMAPFGVPFPPCGLASTLEDAKKIADEIGWPVALKIESKDILHKSDAGCVALNIGGEGALAEAYGKIMDNAAKNYPGAEISGVLVQRMVHPGTEMIIGVTSDPQFGPAILAGLGGVHVEALGDTAVALAPLSRGEARELVLSLKCSKILLGFRGDSPKDIEALTDVVMAVSDMASLMKDTLIELDLNPVFVYDKGACAVDVVIITDSGPEGGNGHPADMGGNHCLEPIF